MTCNNATRFLSIGLIGTGIIILLIFAIVLRQNKGEIVDRDSVASNHEWEPVLKESADKILAIKVRLINNGAGKEKEFEISGNEAVLLHDILSAAKNGRTSQANRRGLATLNILYIGTPLVDFIELSPDNTILINGYVYDIDADSVINSLKKLN